MASKVINDSASEIRENLIDTAVKFLSNPNVQRCTFESKERFLRSKGLNDAEIRRAFEKGVETLNLPSVTSELLLFQQSRRNWFKDHVLPVIIYGGIACGIYWVYKNFIKQLLFVDTRKSTTECLENLRKTMETLNNNVAALRADLQAENQRHLRAGYHTELDSIKSEIASVKAMLLNRNQFPSIKTRNETPTIPAWQRQPEASNASAQAQLPDPKTSKSRTRSQRSESDGSNSSEGDHAAKNSDSSLEIM